MYDISQVQVGYATDIGVFYCILQKKSKYGLFSFGFKPHKCTSPFTSESTCEIRMILTNRMIKFILWPLMASALVSSQMAPKYKDESIESIEESKEKSKEETKGWGEKTTADRHGHFNQNYIVIFNVPNSKQKWKTIMQYIKQFFQKVDLIPQRCPKIDSILIFFPAS